jgi:two-component system chemotaxis sensor kinase CheA
MHQAESLLDQWRKGRLLPDRQGITLLCNSVELARACLNGPAPEASLVLAMTERLRAAANVQVASAPERRLTIRLDEPLRPDLDDAVATMFRDVCGLGSVLSVAGGGIAPKVFEVQTAASEAELTDLLSMHLDRSAIAMQAALPKSRDKGQLPEAMSAFADRPWVRVGVDALESLDRLVAEMAQLATDWEERRPVRDETSRMSETDCDVMQLHGFAVRLQQALQQLRPPPVSVLFAVVPALLSNLSKQLGKQYDLSDTGEALKLDRDMIRGPANPLIQLVRNACDHGIESPQERQATGKPAAGRIELSAELRDGVAVVTLRDDGRGISRDMRLEAARSRGINVAADTPDQSLLQLVFLPGVSTASVVTPISDRGVGMDVVRRKVGTLGGHVDIEFVLRSGTCFTIRLPMMDLPYYGVDPKGMAL